LETRCDLTFLSASRSFSILHEGFESGQCLIPLLGYDLRVFSDLLDRSWIEFEQVFAAGPNAVNDFRALQHAKVLGDGLASQSRTFRQLSDRPVLPLGELSDDRQPRVIGQRRKDRRISPAPWRGTIRFSRHGARCF
jgi:hypothetical protein